jgi:ribonuclease P protein component
MPDADRPIRSKPETGERSRDPKAAGLGRDRRLIAPFLFDEAYSQGRKTVGRWMVLWQRSGLGASLRLGVVSGRKVGGAVQRNRARRRLRNLFRQARPGMRDDVDVVLIARAGIDCVEADRLKLDFDDVIRRARLMAGGVNGAGAAPKKS